MLECSSMCILANEASSRQNWKEPPTPPPNLKTESLLWVLMNSPQYLKLVAPYLLSLLEGAHVSS